MIREFVKKLLCIIDEVIDLEMVRGGVVLEFCMYELILLFGLCIRVI